MDELLKIKEEALSKIHDCSSLKELNDLRVLYLGKKGPMQSAMKSMKDMSKEERTRGMEELMDMTMNIQKPSSTGENSLSLQTEPDAEGSSDNFDYIWKNRQVLTNGGM